MDVGTSAIAGRVSGVIDKVSVPQNRLLKLVIAWLLGTPFDHALLIWGYTILSAFVVNALRGNHFQLIIAASLMRSGLFVLLLLPVPMWFLIVSTFFMIKVMFSFAVDHYGNN
ncbi:hypothetical protein PALB_24580 [Pseudoalteromonas luteoviolacea B = ATCC 29581]|nr:hypothetical protein PALB_24580 [Pseudoalteromonas luteoviolacea B = ATCC 29581]